jgi:methylenetetrahydrofolate dehydrogenase (NADP+) / methenyltetrahydrofolate cyclohydrolase
MVLLDGKKMAKKIIQDLKKQVSNMKKKPVLAMILVGEDPASSIYVRRKKVFCEEAGIISKIVKLPAKTSEKKILALIDRLNKDKNITAIMVQLPLSLHVSKRKVIESIDPKKDADCLHPENYGKFAQVDEKYSIVAPATPFGIVRLLEKYKIKIEGRHAVVVGRSNIVGKPAAQLLLNRGATITVCHRHTKNLAAYTRQADILVVAVGKRNLIRENMVKKGVVVIDVGINRFGKKIFGDVDFPAVSKKASFITPVPGGVGPITIAILLWNTVQLARLDSARLDSSRLAKRAKK